MAKAGPPSASGKKKKASAKEAQLLLSKSESGTKMASMLSFVNQLRVMNIV